MTLREDAPLSTITSAVSPAVSLVARSNGSPHGHVRVSVVVPTLGEESDVTSVLERMPAIVDAVVLVDGPSVQAHRGATVALRAAFQAARGDCIVMVDARDSVDPEAIERFVEALRGGVNS